LAEKKLREMQGGALAKFLFVTRNGKNSKDSGATIFKEVVQEACHKVNEDTGKFVQVSGGERGSSGGEGLVIIVVPLTPSKPFTINTHRHLYNYILRVEMAKRAKERGEDQQADEERENAEQGIAGHSDGMGARYADTWAYNNSTLPCYGDKEILDLFDLSKRICKAIGLDMVLTGLTSRGLSPQEELKRRKKALRMGDDGVFGPRFGSLEDLMNLERGQGPLEIREAVQTFMSSPKFNKIVALALQKEVGSVRAEEVKLKAFQKEGIEELLVGEIGGSGVGNEQGGTVEVGRNLSVEAVCGEGKTLVVTVPALVKQWLLEVVPRGSYFPTIVLYPNIALCKSAAVRFKSCGLRVVELHSQARGGGIEEADTILHNNGAVVICAVVDSFLKDGVLKKVKLWVSMGWLKGMIHEEGQEVSGGRGGFIVYVVAGLTNISLLNLTPPFPTHHSSSTSG